MTVSNPTLPDIDPSPATCDSFAIHYSSGTDNATGDPSSPPSGPIPHSTSATTPGPIIGHGIRGWAAIGDQELISYKKDTKSRHSWKTIGQNLHCDPALAMVKEQSSRLGTDLNEKDVASFAAVVCAI